MASLDATFDRDQTADLRHALTRVVYLLANSGGNPDIKPVPVTLSVDDGGTVTFTLDAVQLDSAETIVVEATVA